MRRRWKPLTEQWTGRQYPTQRQGGDPPWQKVEAALETFKTGRLQIEEAAQALRAWASSGGDASKARRAWETLSTATESEIESLRASLSKTARSYRF